MELPQKVMIKQELEPVEVLTGVETKNKYSVNDVNGQQLLYAYEDSNFASRFFLKNKRPMKVHVVDRQKDELMMIDRPFYFFLPRFSITASGMSAGTIRRRFTVFSREFEITGGSGATLQCISRFAHPWTYNILHDGQRVAQVLKKWSGVGKEMFSDADTFMVDFGTASKDQYRMILATAFAIELTIFEQH